MRQFLITKKMPYRVCKAERGGITCAKLDLHRKSMQTACGTAYGTPLIPKYT